MIRKNRAYISLSSTRFCFQLGNLYMGKNIKGQHSLCNHNNDGNKKRERYAAAHMFRASWLHSN